MKDSQIFFFRISEHKILGGIFASLGYKYEISPWTLRIMFLLLLFINSIISILLLLSYIILWIFLPHYKENIYSPKYSPINYYPPLFFKLDKFLNNKNSIDFIWGQKSYDSITKLYSLSHVFIRKYWENKFDEIILEYWNDYGMVRGPIKFADNFETVLGKNQYKIFIKEAILNLNTEYAIRSIKKSAVPSYAQKLLVKSDIANFATKVLIDKYKIELYKNNFKRPIFIKKCFICGNLYDALNDGHCNINIKPKEVNVCSNCFRDSFCSNPELSKDEMLNKFKDLYHILDDQIPPYYFKSNIIENYISLENHIKLLKLLKTMPSPEKYKEVFGSYFKLLIETNLLEGNVRRNGRGTQCLAKDGHECLSISEKIIDDWMYGHNIKHSKEPVYPHDKELNLNSLRGDWLINDNVFVEFFGLKGNADYDNKIIIKKELAKKYDIILIEIYNKDLNNLKNKFKNVITER